MPDTEIDPATVSRSNPWDQWLQKWFGGGAFGSAAWSPQRWPVAPGASASYWGVPSTQPITGTSTEGTPTVWEILDFPSEAAYIKARPWVKTGKSRSEFERITLAEKEKEWATREKAINPPKDEFPLTEADKLDREKFELQKKQFDWQVEQSAIARQTEIADTQQKRYDTYQKEQERLARQQQRGPADWLESSQAIKDAKAQQQYNAVEKANMELAKRSTDFERLREQILANTAPRQWIIREKAKLAVNPYELIKQNNQYPKYTGLNESVADMITGGYNPYMRQIGPENPTVEYPGEPSIPKEVQGFMNKGQGTFGTPLETPSGQTWGSSPWSTREQVVGYSEALGTPEDAFLEQIKSMLPNNPTRGRNWAVASQR